MDAIDSLSPGGIDALFGLGVDPTTHSELVRAAKTFIKIRRYLEAGAMSLQKFDLRAYHQQGQKKEQIRKTLKKIATHQIEERIVLDTAAGFPNAKALDTLILLLYALQGDDFKEIENRGLAGIFPQLMRRLSIRISVDRGFKQYLGLTIAAALGENICGGKMSAAWQPQMSLSAAPASRGFTYKVADVRGIDVVLRTGMLDAAVKSGRGWREERLTESGHSHLSNSMWVDVPDKPDEDMVFHVKTSWKEGWRLIHVLDFKQSTVLS